MALYCTLYFQHGKTYGVLELALWALRVLFNVSFGQIIHLTHNRPGNFLKIIFLSNRDWMESAEFCTKRAVYKNGGGARNFTLNKMLSLRGNVSRAVPPPESASVSSQSASIVAD